MPRLAKWCWLSHHHAVTRTDSVAVWSGWAMNESTHSVICWLLQTLMVGDSVMGLGNFPCAAHKLMVDFAREVSWLTSAIRSSWSALVILGLHKLIMESRLSSHSQPFSL